MRKDLFEKALAQIPVVVAQIANWNNGKEYWKLDVIKHNKWGFDTHWYTDTVDVDELKSHLHRANSQCNFTITYSEDGQSIIVRRDLPDDEYIIATYTPIVAADGTRLD